VRGTNLFAPLSSFVGRDGDLATLAARFADGAHLVTVVGPPGIGKTRLLQRFGETAATPFLAAGGYGSAIWSRQKPRTICAAPR
jgi:hypothetical protein